MARCICTKNSGEEGFNFVVIMPFRNVIIVARIDSILPFSLPSKDSVAGNYSRGIRAILHEESIMSSGWLVLDVLGVLISFAMARGAAGGRGVRPE
jgi:hypothetical protein